MEKFRKNGERNKNRTIAAKFLNIKHMQLLLIKFREKKLWNKQIDVKEDFSEKTRELGKEFLKKAKEMTERGQNATLVHNKMIVRKDRDRASREENENGD